MLIRLTAIRIRAGQTRITTAASETNIAYIDVDGDMVQVFADTETHMYLGRKIPADLRRCSVVDVAHRIHTALGQIQQVQVCSDQATRFNKWSSTIVQCSHHTDSLIWSWQPPPYQKTVGRN